MNFGIRPLALLISLSFVSCAILKESYEQESSDSSDEEWSILSTPRKTRLQDHGKSSVTESLRSAKRCSRRAPAREQNNERIQSEQLHGSASEQQTEFLRSNVSSGKVSKYHFGPIVSQVYNTSLLLV
jgi:hypothetical protein